MRRVLFTLSLLALAGCSVSEIGNESISIGITRKGYIASLENTDTKVYADTDLKLHWNALDEISIFGSTANQRYVFDGQTGDRDGTFSLQGETQNGNDVPSVYAVYPYNVGTSITSGGMITLELPEVQKYAENSFGAGANTMVAVAESTFSELLPFKNLCGFVAVRLFGTGTIKSVSLRGNNGEKISGQASVAPGYGEDPVVNMAESAGISITLDCGDGVALGGTAEESTAFWFAVPPVTFSQGFTVTVRNTEGRYFSKTTTTARTVTRNVKNALAPLEASVFPIAADIVEFEDAYFKAFCVQNYDTNGDGEISFAEAEAVEDGFVVYTNECYSLKGLEHFVNIRSLDCYGWPEKGKLTSLDVSNNTRLEHLNCERNRLTTIDLSNNTALTYLSVGANLLTELDLSGNPNLGALLCGNNQLTVLDVSQNLKLTSIDCASNLLAELDVSKLGNLNGLYCGYNPLVALDISNNLNLGMLMCYGTTLSSLDLSNNQKLNTVYCFYCPNLSEIWLWPGQTIEDLNYDSQVTTIKYKVDNSNVLDFQDANFKAYCIQAFDMNGDGKLTEKEASFVDKIDVETDEITTLAGIEQFKYLRELRAVPRHTNEYGVGIGEDWRGSGYTFEEYNGYNTVTIVRGKLASVDVSGCPLLTRFDCSGNVLTSVNLSANENLEFVNLNYNNDLANLVLGDKPSLTELSLSATSITSFDFSGLPNLERLSVDRGASMGTIDLSHNTKLQRLGADYRGLTSIDVSNNPELYELSCGLNGISELNISKNNKLVNLWVAYNCISDIDLSASPMLESVMLQNNQIQSIDVTSLPELRSIHFGNYIRDGIIPVNTVSEIDLSHNPKLEYLNTAILDISVIDVSDKENLVSFDCCFNNLIEEIDVSKSLKLEKLYCYSDPSLTKIFISPGQEFNCDKDDTAQFYYKDQASAPMLWTNRVMRKNVSMINRTAPNRMLSNGEFMNGAVMK